MNRRLAATLLLAGLLGGWCQAAEPAGEVVSVRKIWDAGKHNAFTDLIRFHDRWICTFREGSHHGNAADGRIRVLASPDGETWKPVALLASSDGDLRDPKLCVAPDGRLMMDAVLAIVQPKELHHRSVTFFSTDGDTWEGPFAKGDDNFWLWRSTWQKQACYNVGYATTKPERIRLYVSEDGRTFRTLVPTLLDQGGPSEVSLLFRRDGTALALVRHEAPARLGFSQPPYETWTWKTLNRRLGGQHLIELPDDRIIVAGRTYEPAAQTAVLSLDPQAGTLKELVKLPSGGDTSYPGLVFRDGLLWVSYYASHEGKSNIYLAQVRLPAR